MNTPQDVTGGAASTVTEADGAALLAAARTLVEEYRTRDREAEKAAEPDNHKNVRLAREASSAIQRYIDHTETIGEPTELAVRMAAEYLASFTLVSECETCGEQIDVYDNPKRFCSNACRQRAYRNRQR